MAERTTRVVLMLTGGTIGSTGADEFDRVDYLDSGGLLDSEEFMSSSAFPEDVDVTAVTLPLTRSNDIGVDYWVRLREQLLGAVVATPPPAGIVVTHGTATLEETAYFLHLTLPVEVPVVLVGAQRPPGTLGSDAKPNLYNAVRLASDPGARGHGVLVAMNDVILSARGVTKSSNHALETFQPRTHGALGDIDSYGDIWFYRKDLRLHTVQSRFAHLLDELDTPLPRVDIVSVWAGSSGDEIRRAVESGASGIVVASLPPALNPAAVDAAIDAAVAQGVRVVQSSRAATGRVVQRRALSERGLVGSDTLSPQAARILLMLCLGANLTYGECVDTFSTH